jgi:FtsZ-interacting cell division protein ZipA
MKKVLFVLCTMVIIAAVFNSCKSDVTYYHNRVHSRGLVNSGERGYQKIARSYMDGLNKDYEENRTKVKVKKEPKPKKDSTMSDQDLQNAIANDDLNSTPAAASPQENKEPVLSKKEKRRKAKQDRKAQKEKENQPAPDTDKPKEPEQPAAPVELPPENK